MTTNPYGKPPGADVDGDGLIFLKKMILLPLFNGPADFTQDTITDIDNYAALFGGRDKFSRPDGFSSFLRLGRPVSES